jgi:Ser/Thr protein kinase RdoA (MazF antagonist)
MNDTNQPAPLFPAAYSHLSPQAIRDLILPDYSLGEIAECRLYSTGFNDTYRIRLQNGSLNYLRVYRSKWRIEADVACELEALDHLRRQGVPVAYPLPRRDGSLYRVVDAPEGRRHAAVFALAPGIEPNYDENAEQKAYDYGQAVAALHSALDDFHSTHTRFRLDLEHLIGKPLRMVAPFLAWQPDLWDELQNIASRVRSHIEALPESELEQGFCHGDLQGYHHRIAPDGTMTFFDFDCGGFGYRAYDLAVFRWCARLSDKVEIWFPPYLEGYRSRRALSPLDEKAIPLFVACRYIWHMGVHCENSPDWGCGWLNEAYFKEKIGYLRSLGL